MKLLFLALPCVLLASALRADDAILKSEFIYDTGPYPQIHATTIVETIKGNMVSAWFGGTAEKNPDVCIWVSRLVDGKWTEGVEVANGVQPDGTRHPTWNPVLFQPKDAPLMLFYKVGEDPQKWWGELRTSEDEGKTWSAARKLPEGILGPIKNKPVQLPDGTIISPTSTESVAKPSLWRAHFEVSKDLGKTWSIVKPAAEPAIDAIQPSILDLGGGKLMSLGRSKHKKLFQVFSEDLGATWGPMSLIDDLPNPNSGTDAVTLKDGRHLLIYNHTPSGRSPLNIAVSKDGKTWEGALILENEPKKEFSYPAIIQTSDGLVHATYTWQRKKVKHVIIDPAKLTSKPIVDGKWPE